MQSIKDWAQAHEAELLEDLKTLVRIRSVSELTDGPHPFGEGCAAVLDRALEMARSYGFETENHEYYCGSVLYPGETEEELAICTHLDVVPENTGWVHAPYDPYLKEGWVYGRGAADNKGASVAALYILRYMKEKGIRLRHTVRVLWGCDEERGMSDMAYYLKHHKAPVFALVPDAALPAAYAEKGFIGAMFERPIAGNLLAFEAGMSRDSIPAQASAVLEDVPFETAQARLAGVEKVRVLQRNGHVLVEAEGLAAHAAFPHRGDSAAVRLANALLGSGLCTEAAQDILAFIAAFAPCDGSALGIACSDELSGEMSVAGCLIRTENGVIRHSFNGRHPVTADQHALVQKLEAAGAAKGFSMGELRLKPPSFVDPNHPVIEMLTRYSQQAHGVSMKPYAMGGGTYARMFPRAVASGFGLKDQKKPCPPGHGGGHQPDECVSLLNLKNGIAIYMSALMEMDGVL